MLRSSTTSTQVYQWVEHLNRKWDRRDKTTHLFALLRHDIHLLTCAILQAEPWKTLDQCYPEFQPEEDSSSPEAQKRLEINRNLRMQESIHGWFGAVGIDPLEIQGWTTSGKPPEMQQQPRRPVKPQRHMRE